MAIMKRSTLGHVATTRSLLLLLTVIALSVTTRSFVAILSETSGDWGHLSLPVETRRALSRQPMEREQGQALDPIYTLVVVRCRGNMEWLNEVPSDWRIIVYEKCRNRSPTKFSVTTAVNAGPEECNGYLDYIYDYYYNLTNVTVFFHEDGLIPYTKQNRIRAIKNGKEWYHTGFYNFSEVVAATQEFLTPQQDFLHFGTGTRRDAFGEDEYHGEAQKMLWPFFRTEKMPYPPKQIIFKPSGHMAVAKEAIQKRSRDTYGAILQQARYSTDVSFWQDSRQVCCAMERMWHLLFGQPPILPGSAMVYDILNERKQQEATSRA